MGQNNSGHNNDEVVLKNIILKYLPFWYLFPIFIVFALGIAYIFNELSEPVYSIKTTLLISREGAPSPLATENLRPRNRESWQNEQAILQSRTLIETSIENIEGDISYYEIDRILGISNRREIFKDSPFQVRLNKSHPQPFDKNIRIKILSEYSFLLEEINKTIDSEIRTATHFGDTIEGKEYSFMLELVKPYEIEKYKDKVFEFVIHNTQDLIPRYLADLTIEPMGAEYSIVQITFEATNRQRAVDFVSNLTNNYLQQNLAEKYRVAQSTKLFIDNQLAEVSQNLRDTELNLQRFRQRNQVMEVGPVATRLQQELENLDKQKSEEQVKRQYYDLLMEYIRDDRDFSEVFGPSALGIDDPLLNSLLMDLSKLHNERARMLLTTTASTPSVQAIDENIRHSQANLQENIQSLKAASDIMINDYNQRIARIEQRINELPHTERELINLQRLFSLNEANYNFLMEKRAEANIGLASMIPDHSIIDPAHYVETVSPQKTLNYTIALFFGMILPIILLVFRDYFNTRIVDMDIVSRIVDYPIVGLIPHFPKIKNIKDPNPVLFDENRSSLVEAFRSMRSNVLLLAPKTKSKLIVITSTREKEGKTFTAVNLAGSLHLLNRKTIYINADMRKPSTLFNDNISKNRGLSNYLTGEMDVNELISQSGQNDNLYLIPSGKMPPNAAELMESDALRQLLEKLQCFEYIIFDTPPIGLVSDAMPLLTRADITIYMLRHGYSQHSDLDFLRNLTLKSGLKNVALTINDVKKKGRYGYGYGYGYGLGYGLGYGKEERPKKRAGFLNF